jgi:hypothetical protein
VANKNLFSLFSCTNKIVVKIQNCDINIQIMARMCPNHKIATFFANQKCGKIFKKPHKMTFAKSFFVYFTKFRGKSVETGVKNPHKTHFTFQKRGKRGKLN